MLFLYLTLNDKNMKNNDTEKYVFCPLAGLYKRLLLFNKIKYLYLFQIFEQIFVPNL